MPLGAPRFRPKCPLAENHLWRHIGWGKAEGGREGGKECSEIETGRMRGMDKGRGGVL